MSVILVRSKCAGLTVHALVGQNTTGGARGCRRRFRVEVGGLKMGWANLRWRWKQGLATSGEAELVQHSAGGNEAGHTGEIDEAEHTGYLGKVLVDGCEGLTPR